MGRRHHDQHAGENTGSVDAGGSTRRAPGKRNRTDDLPGKPERPEIMMTGFDIADRGTLCEDQPEGPGCGLDAVTRDRLINRKILPGVLTAMENYHAAILRTRIDLMTQPGESWWGFAAELLFGLASGPLVRIATRALAHVAARAAGELAHYGIDKAALALAKMEIDQVKGAVTMASKGVRTSLKNLAHAGGGNQEMTAFMDLVGEQVRPLTMAIIDGTANMNDEGLIALAISYVDSEAHAISSYAAELQELMQRYTANHMQHVGLESWARHGELIWIISAGRKRLGLFRTRGLDKSAYAMVGTDEKPNDLAFTRWIDKDMIPLALGLFKQRAQREPDTYDLDNFEVRRGKTWLEELWLDSLHNMNTTEGEPVKDGEGK